MLEDGLQFGVKDVTYDLVSILYHSLQALETYALYAADAEQAHDNEAANFFREVLRDERERAEQAKLLLAKRLNA